MGKKKKEIRIIKVISNNEDYTFVTDDNLNNTKTESINKKRHQIINPMIELKKRFIQRNHIKREERF